jgi:hypothetical protein
MRKAIRVLMTVLALSGSAVALDARDVGQRPASQRGGQGLCRQPVALPVLPPEAREIEGQQRRGAGGRSDIVVSASRREGATSEAVPPVYAEAPVASVASPSPSPPPPPPPLPHGAIVATPGPAPEARVSPPGIVAPGPRHRPQSGILTAGDHDDLLNPELYDAYVRRSDLGQSIRDLPRVDTARVLTVAVRDQAGQPIPFAQVTLTCADGNSIMLATQADGRVDFFPGLDNLGRNVRVAVRHAGRLSQPRSVTIDQAAGGQQIGFTLASRAQPVRKMDLVLAIDTTGSMGDEIRYLQSELRAILNALRESRPDLDLRVGFVFYKDLGDSYVTRTVALTPDFAAAQGVLAQQSASGGGDYPEAVDQAMIRAVGLGWRPDAVKSLLLVGDAPPHDAEVGLTWRAAEAARAKRIHIVPVAASGVADTAEYMMRAMAAVTQSRYIFLTDDSGIGNPHAPPAVDCYQVTRLDALLRRVLEGQLTGRRVEARQGEVIRDVGQYDAGRCVLPPNYSATRQ